MRTSPTPAVRDDATGDIPPAPVVVDVDVYRPQHDSWLLADAVRRSGRLVGARVADLCTGTGVIARECATLGARSVVAIDSSPAAVTAARLACTDLACPVDVAHGDFADLIDGDGFDVVTCNPPYVPTPVDGVSDVGLGPRQAWEAGIDGRGVLDRLCAIAPRLLAPGGAMFLVQSEFAGVTTTLAALRGVGLLAEVVADRQVPFGPVLHAHSDWLEEQRLLDPGRRTELLSVIRADRAVRPIGQCS